MQHVENLMFAPHAVSLLFEENCLISDIFLCTVIVRPGVHTLFELGNQLHFKLHG